MNKKRLAIIIGGWHYPYHFYKKTSELKIPKDWAADKFVIGHRDPDLEVVSQEKIDIINAFNDNNINSLEFLDKLLYDKIIKKDDFEKLGFNFSIEPNKIGDFYFFNQWSEKYDWSKYDLFLFMHDDTFMMDDSLIIDVVSKKCNLYFYQDEVSKERDWLFLTAGGDQMLTPRASFAFFNKKLIEELDGIFSMKDVKLNREGLVNTPGTDLGGTANWNHVASNFTTFMQKRGWEKKMLRMSPYYRISKYCLEGERGFFHIVKVAQQSFYDGFNEYQLNVQSEATKIINEMNLNE